MWYSWVNRRLIKVRWSTFDRHVLDINLKTWKVANKQLSGIIQLCRSLRRQLPLCQLESSRIRYLRFMSTQSFYNPPKLIIAPYIFEATFIEYNQLCEYSKLCDLNELEWNKLGSFFLSKLKHFFSFTGV